jgi:hypothetical protein
MWNVSRATILERAKEISFNGLNVQFPGCRQFSAARSTSWRLCTARHQSAVGPRGELTRNKLAFSCSYLCIKQNSAPRIRNSLFITTPFISLWWQDLNSAIRFHLFRRCTPCWVFTWQKHFKWGGHTTDKRINVRLQCRAPFWHLTTYTHKASHAVQSQSHFTADSRSVCLSTSKSKS